MSRTRLAGIVELVRYREHEIADDGDVVGDIRIGGVSLPAIWPGVAYETDATLTWECPGLTASRTITGKLGVIARYGNSLEEDWDGCTVESAEWAIIELNGQDLMPQLALLEGRRAVVTLDYVPNPYAHACLPKADYESELQRVGMWAACQDNWFAGRHPGHIGAYQVERLYSTGIMGWVGIAASPWSNSDEPTYDRFAEVRWAYGEEHAKGLRDEWVAELVAAARRAQAEYDEIVRTHRDVIFTDAGGSPYIGIITNGRFPAKGLSVKWHWSWSPVAPLENPVVDPSGLRLLSAKPTDAQLQQLADLAKEVSDSTLAATTDEAKKNKYTRPAPWPFWTHGAVYSAADTVGLAVVELPQCWGTEASDYLPKAKEATE